MKYLFNLLCLASITTMASAQNVKPNPAQDLLQQVAASYREAGALTDTIDIDIALPASSQKMMMKVALGGQDTGHVTWSGISYTGLEDSFYIVKETMTNKYIRKPMKGGFIPTLLTETQGGFPVPHLALRQAKSMNQYVEAFGLGNFTNIKLTSSEAVTHDGKARQTLNFTSQQGEIIAYVDPESKLVASIKATSGPVVVTINMQPKLYDSLPHPITFDTDAAREVDTLRLEVGDMAPDFELEQLDGAMVKLSDLRGSMVVLDFWATWCGPCIRGLPELGRFAKWGDASGHPIKVYAIDAFERVPTNEQKKQKIAQFWNAKNYGFPTLIDYSQASARAYEVGPIPHSVVIDAEGRIHHIQIGYNPKTFNLLKEEADKIFNP